MNRSQNILCLGLLFVLIGTFLLLISSGGTGTGVFFIFPFVFVNTGDIVGMFILLIFVFVIFLFMMRYAVGYFSQMEAEFGESMDRQYIRVGAKCDVCLEPLPMNAAFCSKCGAPVDHSYQ